MTDIEKHLAAATDAAAYSELKDAHNRVLRLLDKKNKSNEELVGAIYRAANDAAALVQFAKSLAPGSLLRHHIAGDIGAAA